MVGQVLQNEARGIQETVWLELLRGSPNATFWIDNGDDGVTAMIEEHIAGAPSNKRILGQSLAYLLYLN
jgi:hypothetical protein